MFDLQLYLRQHATIQRTFNDGDEWVLECACDKERQSKEWHLWINVKKGRGYCYRCKKSLGDLVDIVRYVEGLSYQEAVSRVKDATDTTARLSGAIQKLFAEKEQKAPVEPVKIELPAEFIAGWKAYRLPAYFKARGVTRAVCDRYNIGYCSSGYFANRIIVPVFDQQEELATFIARYMGTPPDGVPKIFYPKGSRTSQVIFNLAEARRQRTVVITEGVFDAIRVGSRAVAMLGKNVSRTQLKQLVEVGAARHLVVMLDRDAQPEAEELADELSELCPKVSLARLPKGRKDPGESTTIELSDAIKRARMIGAQGERLTRALVDL